MKTKLSNCDACNKYREIRRYYGEWYCSDCIRLITRLAYGKMKNQINREELQLELRKVITSNSGQITKP